MVSSEQGFVPMAERELLVLPSSHTPSTSVKPVGSKHLYPHFTDGRERKSDLPKVTQQVSCEAGEGIQVLCVRSDYFSTAKAPLGLGESWLLSFKAAAPEFHLKAYILQETIQLSFVSSFIRPLG